jgi:hypothetical protein
MTAAKPCMGRDQDAASDRRRIDCLGREQLAWDNILNDSYKIMMGRLDPEQRTKLRERTSALRRGRPSTVRPRPGWGFRGPENFLAPLETKNRFANFIVAIEGWRPGAGRAWSGETGTGRVRCRS